MGGCARVALVSLTLSAGFGLAGCAAIDDLKVSIFQWLDPVNFTGEGEELLGYAPETRLIPPAEIPKQAAKAPSKRIKPATGKLQRPQIVVLPPKKPPIPDSTEAVRPEGTEGQSAPSQPTPRWLPSRWPEAITGLPRLGDVVFRHVCTHKAHTHARAETMSRGARPR